MSGILFRCGRLAGASSSFISISFGVVITRPYTKISGVRRLTEFPREWFQTRVAFGQELLQIVAAGDLPIPAGYLFMCFCRNAIERCQASLALGSWKLARSSQWKPCPAP